MLEGQEEEEEEEEDRGGQQDEKPPRQVVVDELMATIQEHDHFFSRMLDMIPEHLVLPTKEATESSYASKYMKVSEAPAKARQRMPSVPPLLFLNAGTESCLACADSIRPPVLMAIADSNLVRIRILLIHVQHSEYPQVRYSSNRTYS